MNGLTSGRSGGPIGLAAFLVSILAMAFASATWADIYRWTDKDGNVNYSDVAPPKEQRIKDVVVVTRAKNAPAQPASATEQELLARIQNLEQQLQAQRTPASPAYVAPPPSYSAYSPPPASSPPAYYPSPPVQPVTWPDGGYDNDAFDNAFYPSYTSVVPLYIFTPARGHGHGRRFGSSVRASGHGSFHGAFAGGHGGGRNGGRPGARR